MTAVQNPSFRMRGKYSARLALLGPMILIFAGLPATARDPGKEAYIRMFACEGPDAKMEIYLPKDRDGGVTIKDSVIGYYALDLSAANKGKTSILGGFRPRAFQSPEARSILITVSVQTPNAFQTTE